MTAPSPHSEVTMQLPKLLHGALPAAVFFCCSLVHADPVQRLKQYFASEVYHSSVAEVFHTEPHPLLRAVVVMQIRLGQQGRWMAELLRDNENQPQLTRLAQASVLRLPPPEGLSEAEQALLREEGFTETWLFINDGRFALRTLALPQP
jgi:hypothetical protein